LHGDFGFAIFASSPKAQETKNRYELVPSELILARHASAPASERSEKRFSRVQPDNNYIQKTSDNNTENKEHENKN
jgi:hypothetical protein